MTAEYSSRLIRSFRNSLAGIPSILMNFRKSSFRLNFLASSPYGDFSISDGSGWLIWIFLIFNVHLFWGSTISSFHHSINSTSESTWQQRVVVEFQGCKDTQIKRKGKIWSVIFLWWILWPTWRERQQWWCPDRNKWARMILGKQRKQVSGGVEIQESWS